MLIDAIGVRQDATESEDRRASGDVPWPTPYSGHYVRRSRGIETSAVTEDAIRLFVELQQIAPGLHSRRGRRRSPSQWLRDPDCSGTTIGACRTESGPDSGDDF